MIDRQNWRQLDWGKPGGLAASINTFKSGEADSGPEDGRKAVWCRRNCTSANQLDFVAHPDGMEADGQCHTFPDVSGEPT